MRCDHPFSQRNKATKRVQGKRRGGWTKFEKGGLGNIGGGSSKNSGVSNPLPTMDFVSPEIKSQD